MGRRAPERDALIAERDRGLDQLGIIVDDGNALYAANLSSGLIVRMPRSGTTFGAPETVALPVQSSVVSPVTRDELTMYFSLGDTVGNDIYVAKRISTTAAWWRARSPS